MSGPNDPVRAPQRADIQSLRGYAVLLVVLYHAKLVAVPAGYLGVDIFFVISGFLIARLVLLQHRDLGMQTTLLVAQPLFLRNDTLQRAGIEARFYGCQF